MKYQLSAVVLLTLIMLGALALTRGTSRPTDTTLLRVGIRTDSLSYSPQILMLALGLVEKHGLNVEYVESNSGDGVRTGLAADKMDIGFMSATDMFPAVTAGVPIKIIASMTASPVLLFVRDDGSITTIADLRSKTIGGDLGGTTDLVTRLGLVEQGIDPNKDVTFVKIKHEQSGIALSITKNVDAIMNSPQVKDIIKQEGGIELAEWRDLGYGQRSYPKASLVGRTDFVAAHQDLVANFLAAYLEAHAYLDAHPDEAAQLITDYVTEKTGIAAHTKETVLEFFTQNDFSAVMDPELFVAMAEEGRKGGFIDRSLSRDEIFFTEFERQLRGN